MDEDSKLIQLLRCDNLPEHLQHICKPFWDLATRIVQEIPTGTQRTLALLKLLESRDCVMRTKR